MAEQKKKKKKQVVELTPAEKFIQLQTLKRATACMLVEQDIYDIYVKLTKDFSSLGKIGEDKPFEGWEQCASLSEECAALADEWKQKIPAERVAESRTVTTTAKERENATQKKRKGKWIALGVLLLIIALIVVYQMPAIRYHIAALENVAGFDELAVQTYEKLGQYKDSEENILDIEKEVIANTKKGNKVSFGNIEWRVVKKEEGKVLLAADTALTDVVYHEKEGNVTWETSTLRQYLNRTFLDKTFSEKEKEAILLTKLKNEDNVQYGTAGGKDTEDKVFILSETELKQYRKALKDKAASMRLRTPGVKGSTTMFVSYRNKPVSFGVPADERTAFVRPMIWIAI